MKLGWSKAPLFIGTIASTYCFSSTWSERMAFALEKGGLGLIQQTLSGRDSGHELEVDISNAITILESLSPLIQRNGLLERVFRKPLRNGFKSGSLASYRTLLGQAKVSDAAKLLLLRTLLDEKHMAGKGVHSDVNSTLVGLLAKDSLSTAFKAALLNGIGGYGGGPGYDSVLVPYLKGSNAELKTAAYLGLGRRIRINRLKNHKPENDKIFRDLKAIADVSVDEYTIRSLAQLGTDSVRNYLAVKCAGSPEKLKTVLMNDPHLTHPGLIAEVIKAESMAGNGEGMKKAIRYGVKEPEAVVTVMLNPSNPHIEGGLKLLKNFPELAPKFATVVDGYQDNQDAAIKAAALALHPLLNNSASQPE